MNYDIDVPLFLGALYGDRRVHDIALLRAIERQSGGLKFDGQVGEYAYNHSCAQRTAGACIEHGCPTYTWLVTCNMNRVGLVAAVFMDSSR